MTVTNNGALRWGILGGAFDPVHNGHITLATEIYQLKKLDGVLIVPSGDHPLKKYKCVASFEQRSEMLALATKEYDFMEISHIEVGQKLCDWRERFKA